MTEPEGKPRLLMADDDPSILMMHQTVLSAKFDIKAVENGAKAWDIFQENPFPVVITDIDMPEMDGHELIRNIRQTKANTQIIIVSKMTDDEVNMWSAFGVIHFVKPVKSLNYLSLAANIAYQRYMGYKSRLWLESLEELMADPPNLWFNTLKVLIQRFEENKTEIESKIGAIKVLYDNKPPDWMKKTELLVKGLPSDWLKELEGLLEKAPWK